MSKKIVYFTLIGALSLAGCCCQEHGNKPKNKCQPAVESKVDDDDSGLDWYTNPANPIGLFSSNWNPD